MSILLLITAVIFAVLFVWTMLKNAKLAAENEKLLAKVADLQDDLECQPHNMPIRVFGASYAVTESDLMLRPSTVKYTARRRLIHAIADKMLKERCYEMKTSEDGSIYTMTVAAVCNKEEEKP